MRFRVWLFPFVAAALPTPLTGSARRVIVAWIYSTPGEVPPESRLVTGLCGEVLTWSK